LTCTENARRFSRTRCTAEAALAQQDLAAQAERLDARREVDLLADDGVRLIELGAERADERQAGMMPMPR